MAAARVRVLPRARSRTEHFDFARDDFGSLPDRPPLDELGAAVRPAIQPSKTTLTEAHVETGQGPRGRPGSRRRPRSPLRQTLRRARPRRRSSRPERRRSTSRARPRRSSPARCRVGRPGRTSCRSSPRAWNRTSGPASGSKACSAGAPLPRLTTAGGYSMAVPSAFVCFRLRPRRSRGRLVTITTSRPRTFARPLRGVRSGRCSRPTPPRRSACSKR
jgi:hypothetical protein